MLLIQGSIKSIKILLVLKDNKLNVSLSYDLIVNDYMNMIYFFIDSNRIENISFYFHSFYPQEPYHKVLVCLLMNFRSLGFLNSVRSQLFSYLQKICLIFLVFILKNHMITDSFRNVNFLYF